MRPAGAGDLKLVRSGEPASTVQCPRPPNFLVCPHNSLRNLCDLSKPRLLVCAGGGLERKPKSAWRGGAEHRVIPVRVVDVAQLALQNHLEGQAGKGI